MNEQLWAVLQTLLIIALVCAVAGVLLLALVYQSLRRIHVPPNADFFSTVRVVPLALVVALDLLGLSLDIFAAPVVWIVLSRFRLHALRNVAAVEALIPFTQPIPLLTIAWVAVRLFGLGNPASGSQLYIIDTDEVQPGEFRPRTRR
jgi:hypothetical protein